MIVKVQFSKHPPGGKRVLIYNQDRTVQFECETPKQFKSLAKRMDKVYCEASLRDGTLTLGNAVLPQDW